MSDPKAAAHFGPSRLITGPLTIETTAYTALARGQHTHVLELYVAVTYYKAQFVMLPTWADVGLPPPAPRPVIDPYSPGFAKRTTDEHI